jgi:hypothetical protein
MFKGSFNLSPIIAIDFNNDAGIFHSLGLRFSVLVISFTSSLVDKLSSSAKL